MTFIDSHTHLYLEEFAEDLEAMMDRLQQAGVSRVYLPHIDSDTTTALLALETRFPELAIPMMGLHPCSVNDTMEEELQQVAQWLERRRFAAVGEIGPDFHWDLTFKDQQMEAFSRQIDWALTYDLPIVIHSRDSTPECLEMVRSKQNGKLRGVFHCFSGTEQEAAEMAELGFYLGIGGVVTFKNSRLPEVLTDVPLSRILLETDAPYLAPAPYRGKRNESAYIPLIAAKIAEIKNVAIEEIAAVTTANARELFAL